MKTETSNLKPLAGHTALPWRIIIPLHGFAVVVNDNGTQIVKTDCSISSNGWIENSAEAEANAKFICLAVNHHTALVEVLEQLLGMCDLEDRHGRLVLKETEKQAARNILATIKRG